MTHRKYIRDFLDGRHSFALHAQSSPLGRATGVVDVEDRPSLDKVLKMKIVKVKNDTKRRFPVVYVLLGKVDCSFFDYGTNTIVKAPKWCEIAYSFDGRDVLRVWRDLHIGER